MDDSVKEPRCTAKIKSNLHTFNSLQVSTLDETPLSLSPQHPFSSFTHGSPLSTRTTPKGTEKHLQHTCKILHVRSLPTHETSNSFPVDVRRMWTLLWKKAENVNFTENPAVWMDYSSSFIKTIIEFLYFIITKFTHKICLALNVCVLCCFRVYWMRPNWNKFLKLAWQRLFLNLGFFQKNSQISRTVQFSEIMRLLLCSLEATKYLLDLDQNQNRSRSFQA